jgi:NitT/TauT family transport system ATP-binding protein
MMTIYESAYESADAKKLATETDIAAFEINNAAQGQINAEQISIHLGEGKAAFEAVQSVDFTIAPGEFVCILGPSGCGKSTLLGALAGHITPSHGNLTLDGKLIKDPSPERGMVFQHHTLLPWRSALDNVAFGLKMQGIGKRERHQQATEMLKLVGLEDSATRWPSQLSGGMQQRVEIARVLINKPRLLLMDEPFGALDAQTRLKMQELLLGIWGKIRTTVVFVTHDIDEALFLADRILVMSPRPGRIIEDLPVDFARPRRTELVTTPEFMRLKRHCLDLLSHQEGRQLPRLSPLGLPTTVEFNY